MKAAAAAWRCGDTCINGVTGRLGFTGYGYETECKCGVEIFNHTAQMWCCNDKPCEGRGEKDYYNYWLGEEGEGGMKIGAMGLQWDGFEVGRAL